MTEVTNTLLKLSRKLFEQQSDIDRFTQSLTEPKKFAQALILIGEGSDPLPFETTDPPKWAPNFVRIVNPQIKAGAHPLHEQGKYYCLDLSSVFAATPLALIERRGEILLDVCASPGGKCVFGYRTLSPTFTIANEVIGKRTPQLISNVKRCGLTPLVVSTSDPRILGEALEGAVDVAIVDAPCTG